jgi:hypothetical protein
MSTLRFARITLAIVVAGLAMGTVDRALGFDGFDGEIANVFFIVAAMLLASLSDRELFWATPPKRHRR